MAYHVDGVKAGENPHVNYEPSLGGLKAPKSGKITLYVQVQSCAKISRTNDYKQAGERYRSLKTGSVMT